MSRKFKILVIGHQLKNQVIAKYPDIVDESQLNGNADELVKAGFVEEVKSEKNVENIDVENVEEVKSEKKSKK